MISEPVITQRIFPPRRRNETPRRALERPEIAVLCHLGMHCNGGGGQCTLPNKLRPAAAQAVRLGLVVQMWFRHEHGAGLTRPFYGLTIRGQQLAAALLYSRKNHKPR